MNVYVLSLLLTTTITATLAQTEEPTQLKTADLTLSGTLTLPQNTTGPVPVVLLIAGSGPTDRNGNNPIPAGQPNSVKANSYKLLADSLAARGVAVLRYDKRGVGTSVKPGMTEQGLTFDTYIQDAVGWLQQLRSDRRFAKIVVAGHSEGSLIGMVAARQAKADAFVSIAGPGDDIATKLKTQLEPQLPEPARQETFAALDSLKAGYRLRKLPTSYPIIQQLFRPTVQPYLISWMKYDPAAQVKLLTVPVLIVQGKRDVQVTERDAERLKAAQPRAQLQLFEAMSHALKDVKTTGMQETMATYDDSYLPLTPGLTDTISRFVKQ